MSFWSILDTLLLQPIQLIFETIYMIAYRLIRNPGLSIVALSLVMNFLILPLYMRADAMQEEEKNMENKLRSGVSHIKKTFKGDERMMILQTYYRQNHYKPTYVLRSAVSLFLEIPFFITAYRFLSNLKLLNGVSFGPISDLGSPDGILTVFGITINVLPIIMTVTNLISCIIFTKGSSVRSKIQLYAMALFFLVFLYSSPAGLVFYWTLNNIFSLIKTIFYKLKKPGTVLSILSSCVGLISILYYYLFYDVPSWKRAAFFIGCGILLQIPLLIKLLKSKSSFRFKILKKNYNKKIFLSGALFLSILTGLLIPSAVIKSSPAEFVDITYFYNPFWFIVSAFCFAVGLFVIWMGVFYWLAKPSVKVIFDRAIWIFSGVALLDYMAFGRNLGTLSSGLKYETGLDFNLKTQLINAGILLGVGIILYFLADLKKIQVSKILLMCVLAITGMSVYNLVHIHTSVQGLEARAKAVSEENPGFTLSQNGKNVIVLMLDRAVGVYIPYLFNEKPELKEQFSGFTYYSNVISFGGHTNFGAPALFGGYEYTPYEMNKRDEESLASKHNEALRLMPALFDKNDYAVTICDVPYGNYEYPTDLSVFDIYPDVKKFTLQGKYTDASVKEGMIENNKRNFFCYSIVKVMPLCFQEMLYDRGTYNQSEIVTEGNYAKQTCNGIHTAVGIDADFMKSYNVLNQMASITKISDAETNTFLAMANDLPHYPMLVKEPEYIPENKVDNTKFDAENEERFTINGRTLRMDIPMQMGHYEANMVTMMQLGNWFDYLRENGVYDNTRIILVADHGYDLRHFDDLMLENDMDGTYFYPLLMVKDFNSTGFQTSDEFMTNADVPTMAMEGLIENPINPFTGKLINMDEKTAHDQYIIASHEHRIAKNNGNKFHPSNWYAVHDNIWDKRNWSLLKEEQLFPEK